MRAVLRRAERASRIRSNPQLHGVRRFPAVASEDHNHNPGGITMSRPFIGFMLALAVLGAVEMTAESAVVRVIALIAIASVPFIAAVVLHRQTSTINTPAVA
jgi:hypothetical protein